MEVGSIPPECATGPLKIFSQGIEGVQPRVHPPLVERVNEVVVGRDGGSPAKNVCGKKGDGLTLYTGRDCHGQPTSALIIKLQPVM